MSRLVPQAKIDGIKAQGAEVRIVGNSQDEAQLEVDRLVEEDGMTMIPPFDNRHVIAGQGTLGLELLDQLPDVETVLVPLSGGGLISGVAAA
jgi:threonine dehydratase